MLHYPVQLYSYSVSCVAMTYSMTMSSVSTLLSALVKDFFVTTTLFKNSCLMTVNTEDEPIFLGPVYLRGDMSEKGYGLFLNHIIGEICKCDDGCITVGSDDDAALRKALHSLQCAFPRSPQLVCTRHVKENVERHLYMCQRKHGSRLRQAAP